MASLAVGLVHGVSKGSKLIVLKSSLDLRDIFWALSTARDVVKSIGLQNQAVVVFTAAASSRDETLPHWIRVKQIMKELFEADVAIVAAAGNFASGSKRKEIDTLPASWSSPDFPLIVAGAVNSLRYRAKFTQGRGTVYAPGVAVPCALNDGASGTSFSAAMVCDSDPIRGNIWQS